MSKTILDALLRIIVGAVNSGHSPNGLTPPHDPDSSLRSMNELATPNFDNRTVLRPVSPAANDQEQISVFILAGGNGTRLWPLSRRDKPKQFHCLASRHSMLSDTILRARHRGDNTRPITVIASRSHADHVRAEVSATDHAGDVKIMLEPRGKGTAIGVALSAAFTLRGFGGGLVLVLPSDHVITGTDAFWRSVEDGVGAALQGKIVVFGVPPTHPETGFGYIEVVNGNKDSKWRGVKRFVEKPDLATAHAFVNAGTFYWNSGIFLFRADTVRDAFLTLRPLIWQQACDALTMAKQEDGLIHLPEEPYADAEATSFDQAIMEHTADVAMVSSAFGWSDLGSWQALMDVSACDRNGNVTIGDVVTLDCTNSYLRTDGRLLSAVGLSGMAVIATQDTTVIAPVARSQDIGKLVTLLEEQARPEVSCTPEGDQALPLGAWRARVLHWLTEEAFPLWLKLGVDKVHGGYFDALTLQGEPLRKPKRMRTMARQIYAFAVAADQGWSTGAAEEVSAGLDFIERFGRTPSGGWVRTLNCDGSVSDSAEDLYDIACVLLALAHAHRCGHQRASDLAGETIRFLDKHLRDRQGGGYFETSRGGAPRRSNPHMHLLEAYLAWHEVTRDPAFLHRAEDLIRLFRRHFFDAENWAVREFFAENWSTYSNDNGEWTDPGHHFEWAALLVDFATRSGETALYQLARKLYSSAVASGLNRTTGLAFATVTRCGTPIAAETRSWQQAEAIKAAIAIDCTFGADLKPEIEARVARLFRWHIASAPSGLWIDRLDEKGASLSSEVPASILYHLTSSLSRYLSYSADRQHSQFQARL